MILSTSEPPPSDRVCYSYAYIRMRRAKIQAREGLARGFIAFFQCQVVTKAARISSCIELPYRITGQRAKVSS